MKTVFLTRTDVSELSHVADMRALTLLSISETPTTGVTPLLQNRPDMISRIAPSRTMASGRPYGFIVDEGQKHGPLSR